MNDPARDSKKKRAAHGKKAAPITNQTKRLEEWREHVNRKLTLLSYHRSHWLGNSRAVVSIRLFIEKHLRK
jgi:hypothetical protein